MRRFAPAFLLTAAAAFSATFGTVVTVVGGATDLVLDEARSRLYVVNNTQNRVDIYSTTQRRLVSSISVGGQPLSAALSRDGRYLYVTSYEATGLDIIDLTVNALWKRVPLPAAPEGVAVGADNRVLITTIGSGNNNAENRLLLYRPDVGDGESALLPIATTLPAPAVPGTTTSSRVYMNTRSNLAASADGNWIIGLNNPTTTSRQLFVYEVASGSILRSRTVTSISNVLAVAPDGKSFMAGLSLFDADTMAIVAQQNTANAMHPFATNANFNTQQNQGGAVFAPDRSVVYSAFNIAPVQNPAARANVSQLFLSDPDNLLIKLTLQLPENLVGNIISSSDGATLYALSQSGFMILPVGAIYDNPIATVSTPSTLLTNDQCGFYSTQRKVEVRISNTGRGRLTATAQVNGAGVTTTTAINTGGAGAGAPGQNIPIVLPPGQGGVGGGVITIPGNNNTTTTTTTTTAQQTGVTQNAPAITTRRTDTETIFEFTFNSTASRSLGTIAPTDFLIQSSEAINVPARIRVAQNNRNTESRGNIYVVPLSISTAEGLVDIVADNAREKVYIANSGMNRVEVFDMRTKAFLDPIKVGQLPRSLAIHPNGQLLYVANSGGESISIIDLETRTVTGKVKFPPVTYNASFALNTPATIVATLNGLLVMMSDGTVWKVSNGEALPRKASAVLGTAAITAPRTLVATPGGEYALLLGGTGMAYLYDAMSDEFVLSQSVVSTPIQGYFGPVAAGPQGQYFVVNGTVLNTALTPVGTTASRPVAAVAASGNLIARYTTPTLTSATAVVRENATIELVDPNTGATRGQSTAVLEGPLSSLVGTQRVNLNGRMMAMDAAGTTAYVLTISGLSVVQLNSGPQPGGLTVNQGGLVNDANYSTSLAQGSILSIFGNNLASDTQPSTPLPTLTGGTCVTIDETPAPLVRTSATQVDVQLPFSLTAARHTLVVRSGERNAASSSQTITIAKYAPAVRRDSATGRAAVYHADGSLVTASNKAKRDEELVIYAGGLGVTHGGTVTAGQPSPSDPLAETETVKVYFGDSRYKQAEMIVESSYLTPGAIGLYEIHVRVPGDHMKGDALPVMLSIAGVNSPLTGTNVPTVAVE